MLFENITQVISLVHEIVLKFHLHEFVYISFQYDKLDRRQIVENSIVGFVNKQIGVMEK